MNHKLLALYGLKFNPFTPEVPVEALPPSHAAPAASSGRGPAGARVSMGGRGPVTRKGGSGPVKLSGPGR